MENATKRPFLSAQRLGGLPNPMSKETLLENYAGVNEVSKRLNIHPESVRRLIRQGKLPAIKFGNKWLVEKAVLEQYASRYDPRPGNKATLF